MSVSARLRNESLLKMGADASKQLDAAQEVSFSVEGKLHTVKASSDITPETSLNTYLRNHAGLRGTKGMCYEGGCGACVVAVTIKHPIMKKERTIAVNSCLIPILSCHGWTINTIEGIGNRKIGYHPIQEALAKYNGTQCGFCSGGMVMNMYALYESNDMLTMKEVENAFGGSLCRCTGYRPILDAFKSLAADADADLLSKCPDIEDLRICAKTGRKCGGMCQINPVEEKRICVKFQDNKNWYKVYSIDDILELFQNMGDSAYRFVAGNTGKGVYKITNKPEFWIDVLSVPDLISHKIDTNLVMGANLSLTDTMTVMKKLADENPDDFWFLKKVYDHIDVVANVPVRNAGTIAGNLSLKHEHHEFPSDIFLLLDSIKAKLTIVEKDGSVVTKSLTEYLKFDMNKCILKSVTVAPLKKENYLFESYKICPRVQNAHAYVNAAFLVEHDNFVVKSARILFGGIDPEFLHAKETEEYLVGKNLIDDATLQGALEKLNEEIKPDFVLPDASPEFRKNLSLALFYKFVLASAGDKVKPKFASGGTRLKRELSSGKQTFDTDKNQYPLTEPIEKLEGLIQCSGEAQYVNDTPAIPGEAYGALVLAEAKPYSKIISVDTSEALKMPGVRAYYDHKDIPGQNDFSPPSLTPTSEQLFCTDKVLYNGQSIGIILANTHEQANEAAKMVKITYEETSYVPSFSVDDVIKNNQMSRIVNAVKIDPKKKGDKTKHTIKGKFEIGAQYHFTMETQSCLCVPTDDGGMDMYPASQWMNHAQAAAARALNIPMNKVNVVVKRIGGAYGAKIVRSSMVSTACAVAAYKLNKPVRLVLPLIENMKSLGKRVPTSGEYEVEVDENGVIQYMKYLYYQPYGLSGMNEPVVAHVPHFLKNSYVDDTWEINGNMVETDLPGNSYCRAPGSTEAVAMIESVMEHIASVTNKDPLDVRRANIRSENSTMPDFVKETIEWTDYENRKKAVDDFNSKNRWMKKGINLVIMEYPFIIFGPYSAFVSVFAADGSVAVTHGGVECGQGINTKVAQVCAHILNIPLDMVSVKASTSLNAPNNMATGGSITSEAVCYGTMQACKEILSRLEPIKEKMKDPTWKELVQKGFAENVELCATHMFSSKSDVKPYIILGTCVCEVTCDLLTGEHNIDRVDLLEDAGQSMSPNVDVGQMEGAFVMGMGYYTSETLIYDDKGMLLSNSTWTYKVPGVKDIPEDFRIKFKQNSTNPQGVLNSKATGEPPLCLSVAVPLAIRRALASARADADEKADPFVPMNGPTTVEYKFQNSLNDYKKYTL